MVLAETSTQLVPEAPLLIHLLMVAVMVFILNRTLLKPINRILAERERQVEGRLQEAQMMTAETEEKLKKYNDTLHEARVDGYRLLEKERAEGLKEKDEAIRLYREEMSREVQQRIENTRRQEESVKKELEAQAGAISSLISTQILRRPTQ